MSEEEIKNIAIDSIYYYLNNTSIYTKKYIEENFNSAISILSENLKQYFQQNQSVKTLQQGQRSITYKDVTLNSFINEIKSLLPSPKSRCGVAYV